MALLATNALFPRKRKRDHEEVANKENNSDDTVISSDHDSSTCEESAPIKAVAFSSVQIHEHYLVLGDNPAVSRGVPLTLSWNRCDSNIYSIDDYEQLRRRHHSKRRRRRHSLPHAYSPLERETIAQLSGSSKGAIQCVGGRVKEIQQCREESELDHLRKRGLWERIRRAPGIIARFRVESLLQHE